MNTSYKTLLQPAFLICVAVLATAGGLKEAAVKYLGYISIKKPLPLQKSLDEMNEEKLSPYKVYNKSKIENKDVLESLGTEEYIQWILEDTDAHENSPVRYCSLFITYYTGNPDQIPHVPEECYVGAGGTKLGSRKYTLKQPEREAKEGVKPKGLEIQHLAFGNQSKSIWESANKFSVMYFFKANGEYACDRTGVRWIMSKNLRGEYSYFSKVEWKFVGNYGSANEKESIEASEKLISVLLPLLEDEHWPDWKAANSKE